MDKDVVRSTNEIVICFECKGEGRIGKAICVDYHKREWDMEYKTCHVCKGSGRMRKTTSFKVFSKT